MGEIWRRDAAKEVTEREQRGGEEPLKRVKAVLQYAKSCWSCCAYVPNFGKWWLVRTPIATCAVQSGKGLTELGQTSMRQ